MNVLVVGAGEMGRWFASHFEDVAFVDTDADVARAAATDLDARVAREDEPFDVVAFAVPMDAIGNAASTHADRARRALVDVTGEMERAVATVSDHAHDREYLSLHPLFAADNAPGTVAVVPEAPGPTTDVIRERLTDAGNELFETTVEEHDRAMETVQARAHTAVLAYALAAEDVPEEFHTPLSAPLADLVDRMLRNEPRVYADIRGTFEGAEDVARAASRIAEADKETFVDLYETASERTTDDENV